MAEKTKFPVKRDPYLTPEQRDRVIRSVRKRQLQRTQRGNRALH